MKLVHSFFILVAFLLNFQPIYSREGDIIADLKNDWTKAYYLSEPVPRSEVDDTSFFEPFNKCGKPPHLVDCFAQTKKHLEENLWSSVSPNSVTAEILSSISWIVGPDRSNLPGTREAQLQIWKNQFPDCSSAEVKFLITEWPNSEDASNSPQALLLDSLHYMALRLSQALQYGRVLVISPGSFLKNLNHSFCEGDKKNSLDCYFLPITSENCTREALNLYQLSPTSSERLMVKLDGDLDESSITEVVKQFGKPWTRSDPNHNTELEWWRAQAIRFFFRHPSLLTCQKGNQIRDAALSNFVAKSHDLECKKLYDITGLFDYELKKITDLDLRKSYLEETLWSKRGPYLPQPLITLQVFTKNSSLLMAYAEGFRLQNPDLNHGWLFPGEEDTDTPLPVSGRGWHFFGGHLLQHIKNSGREEKMGLEELFASLEILTRSDFFVVDLSSPTAVLLNHLRVTNGGLLKDFKDLNS